MPPFWVSAFLDLPAPGFERGARFWAEVTGYRLSSPRGGREEFATLVPPEGDDFLRVQRIGGDRPRLHLDLHVDDPRAAAQALAGLGAVEVADHGYVVMTSPAGLTFCLVTHPARHRPRAVGWPTGASQVDQVCLDLPPSAYDAESAFWTSVTGWDLTETGSPEFRRLTGPPDQPLQLLLQRLDDEQPAGAHLDLAADDRDAEAARHIALGATEVGPGRGWTVLRDPAGALYCVTGRPPR